MARPLRIEFPGAIYHVSSRMVGSCRDRGERLFRDDKDHQRFDERLAQGVNEAEPLDPEEVITVLGQELKVDPAVFKERRRNSCFRAGAAKCLIRYSGQTQRQAAQRLGLGTGAAVSAQLKGLPAMLSKDRPFRRAFDRATAALERLQQRRSSAASKR